MGFDDLLAPKGGKIVPLSKGSTPAEESLNNDGAWAESLSPPVDIDAQAARDIAQELDGGAVLTSIGQTIPGELGQLSLVPEGSGLLSNDVQQEVRFALQNLGEITGINFNDYPIKASPFDDPMTLRTVREAQTLGEQPALYLNTTGHTSWVLPCEVARAVLEGKGYDQIFTRDGLALGDKFSRPIALHSDTLQNDLLSTFANGTAVAIIVAAANDPSVAESSVKILERACESFVAIVDGEAEMLSGEKEPEAQAFQLAREVAIAEVLLDKAVKGGVLGSVIPSLRARCEATKKVFERFPLNPPDRKGVREIFQSAAQAGAEIPFGDTERSGVSPGMGKLLVEVGVHGERFDRYISSLMRAFQGVGSPETREWLPGGRQFDKIQGQRQRWGKERFTTGADGKLPEKAMNELFMYFREVVGQPVDTALDSLQRFLRNSYSH